MTLVFKILCGVLYGIGLMFGLIYEEISVYICCHAVCIITVSTSLLVLWEAIRRTKYGDWEIVNATMTLLIGVYCFFLLKAAISYISHSPATIDTFYRVMGNLQLIAHELSISYEEVNILIYVILFPLVNVLHILMAFLIKPSKKKVLQKKMMADNPQPV